MNVDKIFQSTDWHKKWVVNGYTILGSSFIGHGYVHKIPRRYGLGLKHNFFVLDKGVVTCYQSQKENEDIGKFIDLRIKKHKIFSSQLSTELLKRTKSLRILFRQPPIRLFNLKNFNELSRQGQEIIPSFVAVSRCGKLLINSKNRKDLDRITKARIKTDSILIEIDRYLRWFLELVAKKEKINKLDLTVLSWDELVGYIKTKKLPGFAVIRSRYPKCGYIYNGKDIFLNKSETDKLIKKISESHMYRTGFAKGHGAYPGQVKGRVMIVEDPAKVRNFKQGQILVAGMTRPDFLPLMKKAGAIVTDAGGVLCHAAIISREFKIPCIVGTQIVTKVFKDGDLVEVDANKGIVKKL